LARSSRNKQEEILGLLLMTIGVLTALSLLPGSLTELWVPDSGYHNLVGLAGQFINESLKDLLGILAYSLPIVLVLWGWRIFRGRPSPFYLRSTVFVLFIGLGLSVLSGLIWKTPQEIPSIDLGAGRLGSRLAGLLVTGLGSLGAYLVTGLAVLIFLILYTGLSLRTLADGVIKCTTSVAGALSWVLKKSFSAVYNRGRRKKSFSARKKGRETLLDSSSSGASKPEEEFRSSEGFDFSLGPVASAGEETLTGQKAEKIEMETELAGDDLLLLRGVEPQGEEGRGRYVLPPIDLLDPVDEEKRVVSDEELEKMGRVLMAKLADFNVEGELLNITRGPQVSTFEIRPAPGVKVNRIAALADDLAMAMHAKRIRILAPIPGKGVVGVELPNPVLEVVRAREIFESEVFKNSNFILPLGLGKDLEGRIRVADLTRMPHLLIAGTTGSGKSVCMNIIIASLLFNFEPHRVRLLMIDPKMIELNLYNDIPHLLHPVVTEAKEAARILKWAVFEMDHRYRMLSRNSVRNIEDFNYKVASGKLMRPLEGEPEEEVVQMPYIVILVDELSDLMCSEVKNEIEASLVRLAQMARAVGIHLVVATQRPSVDVITGLIKANFPSRISFQVYSKIDSRTILDVTGAEQLLRNGDMLFMPTGQADPVRIQGAFLSNEEIERLVAHWGSQPPVEQADEDEQTLSRRAKRKRSILDELERRQLRYGEDQERDELFNEAAKLVVRHDQGSTSLIQRRLKVGYARAGRIVDQLERAGILGPPDGSKARDVLITEEQLKDYGIE